MKKLLVLVIIAIGGLLIWRKVQADRAELDLWTEATGSDN
ncbi:DLW-39 family protein [Rhizohabitans arisaemae]|nr:DLW-39 family protein [Rhizohabitans arisaemae]